VAKEHEISVRYGIGLSLSGRIGDTAAWTLANNSRLSAQTPKACVEEAVKRAVRISIVILDQFGEPVYFYSMDGQGKTNIETAFMKARTVLNARQPSKATMNQVLTGRSSEARQISFGNFPNSGALPIIINGNQFIGAVGVGGSAQALPEWSDEICAHRAFTKVMGPQPPLLPDVQASTPTR
jgi:uncharacterized protein GlcG (DUF336 family)